MNGDGLGVFGGGWGPLPHGRGSVGFGCLRAELNKEGFAPALRRCAKIDFSFFAAENRLDKEPQSSSMGRHSVRHRAESRLGTPLTSAIQATWNSVFFADESVGCAFH